MMILHLNVRHFKARIATRGAHSPAKRSRPFCISVVSVRIFTMESLLSDLARIPVSRVKAHTAANHLTGRRLCSLVHPITRL